jgi:hypothetical protein
VLDVLGTDAAAITGSSRSAVAFLHRALTGFLDLSDNAAAVPEEPSRKPSTTWPSTASMASAPSRSPTPISPTNSKTSSPPTERILA